MTNTFNAFYSTFEWITKLALLNLLWLLFALGGGILLGIFPSTLAMFAVIRQWLKGNTQLSISKLFWHYYKADFWKGNILGAILYFLIGFICLDLFYIKQIHPVQWTYIPLFAFILLIGLLFLYIFPTFVHFEIKLSTVFKNTFFIMLLSPLTTIMMVICLTSIYFIIKLLPALAFIFGGSATAFILMWLSLHAFSKVTSKNSSQHL
ncbi:YesL family protein [Guptibacillus hwajinpoensis]|uniref:YesL family protein n=1 Tax=Guptibacillus hwajinpoensis TaxID=208199 RepID=UPI001CFE1956|nr:DUF624 domain-containing protein [Pseudalkalibacillus hwajinpoensis]WLR60193.1 DUF624 domain-containing protein [Pseudalkalibacillus hwajinpoensis]